MKNQNSISTVQLPLVALRGLVLFPNTVTSIDIARDRSLDSVRRAMEGDGCLFAVAQRDSMIDHPSETDLFSMGTIVHIKHIVPQPDQCSSRANSARCFRPYWRARNRRPPSLRPLRSRS